MQEITQVELEAAMTKNGKIENVCVFISQDYDPKSYYRMCIFHNSNQRMDSRITSFLANESIWLFIAPPLDSATSGFHAM